MSSEIFIDGIPVFLNFLGYMFIIKSPGIYDSFISVSSLSKFAFVISRKILWLGGQ